VFAGALLAGCPPPGSAPAQDLGNAPARNSRDAPVSEKTGSSFGANPASLVAADRALQKATQEDGLRPSIVARAIGYAVLLAPRPVGAHGWLKDHDLPFDPRSWELSRVEVSGSGTIGYTVSHWTAPADSNGIVPQGEQIFVWRYHPLVGWKLLLHAAVRTPATAGRADADSLVQLKLPILYGDQPGTHEAAHTEAEALADADRALTDSIAAHGWRATIAERLTADAQLLREGEPLHRGRQAVVAALGATPDDCRCEMVGSHAADSADLGYTYGRCAADSNRVRFGYARIWRKDEAGARHIELQLEIPIPADIEE
jgi:hypothetical protein